MSHAQHYHFNFENNLWLQKEKKNKLQVDVKIAGSERYKIVERGKIRTLIELFACFEESIYLYIYRL